MHYRIWLTIYQIKIFIFIFFPFQKVSSLSPIRESSVVQTMNLKQNYIATVFSKVIKYGYGTLQNI